MKHSCGLTTDKTQFGRFRTGQDIRNLIIPNKNARVDISCQHSSLIKKVDYECKRINKGDTAKHVSRLRLDRDLLQHRCDGRQI